MKPLIISLAAFLLVISCNSKSGNIDNNPNDSLQQNSDTTGISDNSVSTDKLPMVDESNVSRNNTSSPTEIKWTKLVAGSQSRMEKRAMLLITNKTKFDELWAIAFREHMAPQKPDVDFTKNSVLVLFLGEVISGGHSIEPVSIQSFSEGHFNVDVRHLKPGSNCITTSVLEYPYYFALTEKIVSEKSEFKFSEREIKCD